MIVVVCSPVPTTPMTATVPPASAAASSAPAIGRDSFRTGSCIASV
jgi:hypothetical protein